jgi:large subunit ribosomal protein L3
MGALGLIGKKLGMTRIFGEDGSVISVTVIQADPCPIMQVKDVDTDGYSALQIGAEADSARRLNRPQRGHQAKADKGFYRKLQELRVDDVQGYELGQELTVGMFSIGERINVTGTSKGRGFAGVMRRWNFGGSPASHGHEKVHRATGAVGQCAAPSRIFKGKKMPGRMGAKRVTVQNAEVVDIRPEKNLILLRGQVPGAKDSTLTLRKKS